MKHWNELVILCIGTMRIRGDSLGPLVGSCLFREHLPGLHIYGTEEEPVHALNLKETLQIIRQRHPGVPVLAIDAASGPCRLLGRICIGSGPLYPGAGLDKDLPAAGDAHITGVLGITGPFSLLSLRLTSRKKVTKMAQAVTCGIVRTLSGT